MPELVSLAPRALGYATRLGRWLRARVRADHATIMRAAWRNDHGGRSQIYVNVACAPSKRHLWRIRVAEVKSWAQDLLDGRFQFTADWVTELDLARFIGRNNGSHPDAAQLTVWPSGLVELTYPVAHRNIVDAGGSVEIGLVEIADALRVLIQEVNRDLFQRLYNARGARRVKLDWFVSCSGSLMQDQVSVPLFRFAFGHDADCGRPQGREMTAIAQGTSEGTLRSLRQDVRPSRIIGPAIRNILSRTGHYDYEAVVRDLLSQLGTK